MRWLFWASWIAFAILGAAIFYDHQFSQDGEPFAVLQGVSAWPADIILLGTIVFSIYALLKGRFDLRKNALDVSFRYQLPLPPRDSVSEDKSNRRTEGRMVSRIYKWLTVPATNDLITDPKYTKGDEVWSEYMRRSHGSSSGRRILRVTLVYLVLGLSLCVVFDWPFRPTRGPINTLIDQVLLTGALLGAAVLTFFVAHASGHAQWLIDWLTKWPVKWSEQTLQQVRRREGLKSNEAPEWLDIQIIAARTAAVDQLFYYPFVAIAMIIIAHTTLFDRYPWSPPLVLLYVLNVIFAVFAMVRLTTAAREAKDRAIRTLELKRLSTIGREDSSAKGTSSRAKKRRRKVDQLIVTPELVNASIQQLKDLNEGAFRKFTQRPIFTATSFLGAATVFKVLDLLVK